MRALLLLGFIFSLSCWGQSQDAPKKVPPVADKAASANKTKTEPERQNAVPAPPVNVFVSNAANAHSDSEKHTGQHEATNYAEWLVAIATAILAGVTVGLVYYTKRLWGITEVLATEAKQSSEQQLRAYVFAKHDKMMFLADKGELSVEIAVKNFGQTPANAVMSHMFIGLYKYPLDVTLDPPDFTRASNSPLAPSETIKQFPTMPRQMTGAENEAVTKKEGAIFVWGEVRYTDIFKNPRTTKFRLYSTGEDFSRGELAYHHDGNDAT